MTLDEAIQHAKDVASRMECGPGAGDLEKLCAQEHRELIGFLIEAKVLRAEVERIRAALEEIRQSHGHVCPEFETCRHVACRDSHAAWEIANSALVELDACGFFPGDKVRHQNGWYTIDRIYKASDGGLRVVLRTRFGGFFDDTLDSISRVADEGVGGG